METFIDMLQALLFFVKAGMAVAVIVLAASIVTWLHDELQEMRAERSLELARNREDLRQLKDDDTTYFTHWVGSHRREKAVKKNTGKHRVIKGEPSYSQSNKYVFAPPKRPIYNDDNFFATLLREKEETASLF